MSRLLHLGREGVLLLVHPTPQARLRQLCLALMEVDPGLRAAARAREVAEMPPGALVLLGVTAEDAGWLNHNRPLFSQRGLRVVLWPAPDLGGAAGLRAAAPDFFDWISDVVALPDGPPSFAVAGLRAGLGWRPGIAWGGGDLDGALAAAGVTGARRVSARAPYGDLLGALNDPAPVVWTEVDDVRELWRVQWALAERRWTGVSVLEAPQVATPRWWPAHGRIQPWWSAAEQLAGAQQPALLAALLDLEPELVQLAAAQIAAGKSADGWAGELPVVSDPGVWLAERGVGPSRLSGPGEEPPANPATQWAAEVEGALRHEAADWVALVAVAVQLGELDVARRWVEAALARTAEDTAEEVVLRRWYGTVLHAQGHLEGARRQLERSVALGARVFGTEIHLELAPSLHMLAIASLALGDLAGARASIERSIAIQSRSVGANEGPGLAASLSVLAKVLRAQGDVAGARQCLERSLAMTVRTLGTEDHPEVAVVLYDLANVLVTQGELPSARVHLERALAILSRAFGSEERSEVAACLHSLATVLYQQGDLADARTHLEHVLAIQLRLFGTDDHPDVASTLHTLASVMQAQGDFGGARAHLERALVLKARIFGTEKHPSWAASLHQLAWGFQAQGDLVGARQAYERALEVDRRLYGTVDNYNASVTELNLAQVLLAQGERAQATRLLEHALEVFKRTLPPDHPLTGQATTLLGAAR